MNYGTHTIRELISELQNMVKEHESLSLDSPVFIGNYDMSDYKHSFNMHPIVSPYTHSAGICLFHSLGEETDKCIEKDITRGVHKAHKEPLHTQDIFSYDEDEEDVLEDVVEPISKNNKAKTSFLDNYLI